MPGGECAAGDVSDTPYSWVAMSTVPTEDAASENPEAPEGQGSPEGTPRALLHAAVTAVGGVQRAGQEQMTDAVSEALDAERHLLVQAGTGTGKSLAYLVPALAHGEPVVVATATLALQRQLVERDLPRTVRALRPLLHREPSFATLKGRSNYLCLHRVNEGAPEDGEDGLFDPAEAVSGGPTGKLGREVVRLAEWAGETETGDRDDLSPGVSDRAWAQLSVSSRECLGATRCPYGPQCFAEQAREHAYSADVVVTNHALLAIDALEGAAVLPEHQVLIVDEGHELVSRVTSVATNELAPWTVNRAAKRAAKVIDAKDADALESAAENFNGVLELVAEGRLTQLPQELRDAVTLLRDAARRALSALTEKRDKNRESERDSPAGADDAVRKQAVASVETAYRTAERLLLVSPDDVVWVRRGERFGGSVHVAPLSVAGMLRENLFTDRTVVLTSATLRLGGDFSGVAGTLGLAPEGQLEEGPDERSRGSATAPVDRQATAQSAIEPPWRSLDVGSPFAYPRQGMLYVAGQLPPPGRDPERPEMLAELADLVRAAGGRTLGLFSSMRGARQAAEKLRDVLDFPILLQGEETLGELIRGFAAERASCLFGTLSLWQGVDVPGSACQLVVLDRLPFPRPDDPLMSARQQAVERAGGNGFMTIAASHAALLMAQGSGRLIRAMDDRGVVAVLDPRMATARYGGYLRQSMPPFWYTTDGAQVRRSLAAIDASAPEPLPVPERSNQEG